MWSKNLVGRPEPAVDQLGEELGLVTTIEVAPLEKQVQSVSEASIYCLKNLRPEVQKNFTPPSMKPLTQSYSCWVSKDTRSMQRFLEEVRYQDTIGMRL